MKNIPIQTLGPASIPSPVTYRESFVSDDSWIQFNVEVLNGIEPEDNVRFEKAGPRAQIYFAPAESRAAVVTCGGLSPGLNNVIRSLVTELHFHYGVPEIWGIRNGYMGLNPDKKLSPIVLSPALVDDIHTEGGTILGTSRGRQDTGRMVDYLEKNRITQLFCVGGDGTLRGAIEMAEEIRRRGLPIAIIGIPKTIDNDVYYCDRTFGFLTAVEAASDVIEIAHVEAKSAPRGIGLVKVMGRDAGFIACGTTISSQKVNFTLIPELNFDLEGPGGFLDHLTERMNRRDHAIVLVAEGAGQRFFDGEDMGTDASGNRRYGDIGLFLRERIDAHFKTIGKPVEVKYIDPSYIVRGIPANSEDSILCDQLARGAAHAAMAGKTDCMIANMHNRCVHVPLHMTVGRIKQVDLTGPIWPSVLAATGQSSVMTSNPK